MIHARRIDKGGRSIRERTLDSLARILAEHLAVFGQLIPGGHYLQISARQLARGRFAGGAERFVIEDDGLVFTNLRVRRQNSAR